MMSRCYSITSRYASTRFFNRFVILEHTKLPIDIVLQILSYIPTCIVIVINHANEFVKYKCKHFKRNYYTGYLHKENINVLCMSLGDKFQLYSGKSTIINGHCTIYVSASTKFKMFTSR